MAAVAHPAAGRRRPVSEVDVVKRAIIFFVILFGFITMPLHAHDVPPLRGHVNDYANMLTPVLVQSLERELAGFEKKESTQIVVLTIPSLSGEVLEEYSIKVAQKWKIGQKKLDNGVILLVAKQERKIRIEVGYGLEGRLTDLLAGRIIDNEIKPWFKKGEYSVGVKNGASAIMQAVKGEYSAADAPVQEVKNSLWKTSWFQQLAMIVGVALFMGLIVLIMFIFAKRGYGGESGGSSSSSYGSLSGSSSSSSSGGSSGSYSGGGGSFGGGGASGDW